MNAQKIAILGSYRRHSQIDRALDQLRTYGFENQDISILTPYEEDSGFYTDIQTKRASEAGSTGLNIGALGGGVLGLMAGFGTLALPMGNLSDFGPLVHALAGVGLGGALGGLTGWAVGWINSERKSKTLDQALDQGLILLSVYGSSFEDLALARRALSEAGATGITLAREESYPLLNESSRFSGSARSELEESPFLPHTRARITI